MIILVKYFIIGNPALEKDDWEYMKNSNRFFDIKQRCKYNTPLSKEDEDILERCKGNPN